MGKIGKVVEHWLPFLDDMHKMVKDFPEINSGIVSHYTSVSSFKKMIEGKSIRSFHISYMNDPNDGMMLFNSVLSFIYSALIGSDFEHDARSLISAYRVGYNFPDYPAFRIWNDFNAKDAEIYLYILLMDLIEQKENFSEIMPGTYVVSFIKGDSTEKVHMWKSYAAEGTGLRMDFDVQSMLSGMRKINKIECVIRGCKYLNDDEVFGISYNIVLSILKNAAQYNYNLNQKVIDFIIIRRALNELSTFVKASHYDSESEVRLIMQGNCNSPDNTGYQEGDFLIKPYRNLDLNLSSIKKIICGPRSHPKLEESLRNYMKYIENKEKDDGYVFPKIERSKVGYVG